MISTVLNSKRYIQVYIHIMRTSARLRELMISHKDLARKVDNLERKFDEHDKGINLVFQAMKQMLEEPKKEREPIGFHA